MCPCGKNVDVNCAMNCKKRDFVSTRHNNREFEANLIKKKICRDVKVEPKLQPINNEDARCSNKWL